MLNRFCIPNPDKIPGGFSEDAFDDMIGSFGLDDIQEIAEDIIEGKWVFFITFLTCIGITLVYAFLIYQFTGILVWTSVIGVGVGILLMAFLVTRWSRKNRGKKKTPEEDKTAKRLKVTGIVLYVLGILFFCALCCMWKNLAIAIAVLKTSAVIVMRNTRMLFMPFVSSFVIVLWSSIWVCFFILLMATGKITQPKAGAQYKTVEFNEE